jgi:hypothetical protein
MLFAFGFALKIFSVGNFNSVFCTFFRQSCFTGLHRTSSSTSTMGGLKIIKALSNDNEHIENVEQGGNLN